MCQKTQGGVGGTEKRHVGGWQGFGEVHGKVAHAEGFCYGRKGGNFEKGRANATSWLEVYDVLPEMEGARSRLRFACQIIVQGALIEGEKKFSVIQVD